MRQAVLRTAGAAVLVFVTTSCVRVYPPEAPKPAASPASASAAADKGPFEPWDKATKDTRAIDGFIRAHLKRDNTLFLEIQPEQLERDFGMVMHYARGVGVYNAHAGLPLSDMQLMRFRRVGDKVYLVRLNPRFTAERGSPMEASLHENVGHSVVAAFDIESEHSDTNALLVDATPFFVSDYTGVSERLEFYYGDRPVRLDRDRSYVEQVLGFPENLEIDGALTFEPTGFPRFSSGAGVSDIRSIPIGVRYSIVKLPDEPMRPRLADDRVGHFLDAVRDFSRDKQPTPYVRYVNRWRLEKKEPTAAVSEPVKPIVFYIDHSVPHAYRPYVKEGIEAWNKGFEAAGIRNAIVAREAPEDSLWAAEDARYSTVKWTAAHEMGYAIGPSQTDPRTGEILNADILISSTFVTGWGNEYAELVGPEGLLTRYVEGERLVRELPRHMADRVCLYEMGKRHQLGFQHAALSALGIFDGTEPMPEKYLGDAIRDLVMHEVGHTLGLRHNFKGSSAIPYDKLNDPDFTRENGLTLSVMDYAAVNINPDRANQGHYVNMEVGSYDVWAIRYAYSTIYEQSANGALVTSGTPVSSTQAELPGLRKIAAEVADPLHAYNTDEDTHLGPMGVDPLSNTWDLGSDAVAWAKERSRLVMEVQPRIESRLIAEGEGYQRLRGAVSGLTFERFIALLPLTKYVGGLYFARDHKGDPNARMPFTPVTAERQREAVAFLVEQAFAPGAFRFEPDLLNKLPPSRWSDWSSGFIRIPIDFPVHQSVGSLQASLLAMLLDNGRLQRMIDNTVRMPRGQQPYTVAELFETVTDAIWSELGTGAAATRDVGSFRRNLQRAHVEQLTGKLMGARRGFGAPPEDARSLARWELDRLSTRIGQVLQSAGGLDVETRAHLAESKARIDRALEASLVLEP